MARTIAKDHDEKRAALLKTAAGFFAENGYDRASMNELAKACGVSKALIYHYYESKDALLFDILHSHLTELLETVEALPPAEKPQEGLLALTQAILAAYRDADAEHKVQINALGALPEESQRELRAIQRRLVAIMSDRIQATAPELFSGRPELLRPVAMSAFGMLNWYRASPMIVPPMDAPFELPADYQPPQLPNLSIPTLVIWAMDDIALPPGNMVGMEDIIDDLTIEKLSGCGHFVPWEAPEKFNAAMDAFLARTA